MCSIVEYITWAVFCLENLRMMMGRRWVEMMDDHGPPRVRKPLSDLGKNNPGLQCVKMRNVEVSILTSWRAVCVRLTSRCFWVGIVMTANQPQESTSKCSMARARLKVRFIFEWEVSILTSSKCSMARASLKVRFMLMRGVHLDHFKTQYDAY